MFLSFVWGVWLQNVIAAEFQPTDLHPGIVKIQSVNSINGVKRQGSGFIVNIQGQTVTILTAAHVIAGDAHPRVQFYEQNGTAFLSRVRKGSELDDAKRGLALLEVQIVNPIELKIQPLVIWDEEKNLIKSGDEVWVVGIPRLLNEWTPLKGQVVLQ